MKTKTFTPMGALHPVLFFVGVYAIVLFFSIFICSSLFHSFNSSSSASLDNEKIVPVEKAFSAGNATAAVSMR